MGRKDGENLNITCPCCQAKLVVDPKVVRPEMRPARGFTRGDSPAKA